jgi:Cu(I)/Ag(I) efflux system membrane protein CusA/SilA
MEIIMNDFMNLVIKYKFIIVVLFLGLSYIGYHSLKTIKLDALPDISDVQVIVKASYSGQSPDLIEEQITNPLSKVFLSTSNVKTVRSFSFFNDAYIYIIFEEKTDIYWARTRVNEKISQIKNQFPQEANINIGADSSGVGWIFQYALTSTKHDLSELKSLQDFHIKNELESVKGVSEVASIGGFNKQYQVVLNPIKIHNYRIDISYIKNIILKNNNKVGGSTLEMGEAEYIIRGGKYLKNINDISYLPLNIKDENNNALYIKDIATVIETSTARRGIAELNGEGEVVGGIVVMRYNENALSTIKLIKNKISKIKESLPEGVDFITTYDRSNIIINSIDNLKNKISQEVIAVAIITALFLFHFKSILLTVIVIPVSILISFIFIKIFGINSNIMSLGGIAISIGAIIDGAIIMIDNTHKHLEEFHNKNNRKPNSKEHWELISQSSSEVGKAILSSLLIIVISFLPVFMFENQEGKLFEPLAATKTIIMLTSAIISLTLIPILLGLFLKNSLVIEKNNFINRFLINSYSKILRFILKTPKTFILLSLIALSFTYIPLQKLNSEFIPDMNEGDLLYMPSTIAGISADKASDILQDTNKLIKKIPEVKTTFGKIGRANTSTDPAPLTMIETTIQLKPKSEWRKGILLKDIISELDNTVSVASLRNSWVQPIKTRIDMLSTGLKTPLGIQVFGKDIKEIEKLTNKIEKLASLRKETTYAFSEKTFQGRFIDIEPNLDKLALYGLNIENINDFIKYGIGGLPITSSLQGDEKYNISLRLPKINRDNIHKLKKIAIPNKNGTYVSLEQIANIKITEGAPILKSENGKLYSWVFLDTNINYNKYISLIENEINTNIVFPSMYYFEFSGQFESINRVNDKLMFIAPIVFLSIFIILYLLFNSLFQVTLIMATLPFALSGGIWFMYFLGFKFSIATIVGLISLLGISIEFGVVMLIYLNKNIKNKTNISEIKEAIIKGASDRIRPKIMTVATLLIGLSPIMFGTEAGYEIMQRIAAPMIGGMITAPILSLFIIPTVYYIYYKRLEKNIQR